MSFVDIFVIAILLWAAWRGWRDGFIKQLSSLCGFVVGLVIAALLYSTLGQYLAPHIGTSLPLSDLLAFLLLWIVVPIVLGFVATVITKSMRGVIGLPNRLLGVVLSCAKYVILLSCIFNAMSVLGIIDEQKQRQSALYAPVKDSLGKLFAGVRERKARQDSIQNAESSDTVFIYRNAKDAAKARKRNSTH